MKAITQCINRRRNFFVPDLSPEGHPEIRNFRPRLVFVAESPHVSEVTPEHMKDRCPLCGMAGKKWWALLGKLLEEEPIPVEEIGLSRLLRFCLKHQIAVINAVQYPLDPKIIKHFPHADPILKLGFAKTSGHHSYKKKKGSLSFSRAVSSLKKRLDHPQLRDAEIYCLGNDADWFVAQALGPSEYRRRVKGKIVHPSAWWRKREWAGRAEELMERILR